MIIKRALNKWRGLTDFTSVGVNAYSAPLAPEDGPPDNSFYDLRMKLVDHITYKMKYRRNELEWLN